MKKVKKVKKWLPFQPAEMTNKTPQELEALVQEVMKHYDISEMRARARIVSIIEDQRRYNEIYINNIYQVIVQREPEKPEGWPELIYLSIKRLDKHPVHDWRHLQRIKNELVGEECEAVELYPAESRLLDTSNQYHLWCIKKPGVRFPFGFNDGRNVSGKEEAEAVGAKQRELDKENES